MKFKPIFILFNAIVILSFLVIFFMPLFILGGSYAMLFWKQNWYLALIFGVVITLLDSYFIANWPVFQHLENENWNALMEHLEKKIFQQNKGSRLHFRLWINTAMAQSDVDKVTRLARHLAEKKPRQARRFALLLGIPQLLKEDPAEAVEYFNRHRQTPGPDAAWLHWCAAFSLSRQEKTEEAALILRDLLPAVREPELQVLVLYLSGTLAEQLTGGDSIDLKPAVEKEKARLLKRYPRQEDFQKHLSRRREENILLVLLSRLFDDAAGWVYSCTT